MQNYINKTKNYYTTYFIDEDTRPLILIIPGGGYKYTSPRESEPVAKFYNRNGYHAVVLNYREDETEFYPVPGNCLAKALSDLQQDKRCAQIIGLGFSAGGHLLLDVALNNEKYNILRNFDYLMLGYPVVTSNELYWHKGSFENLLGKDFNNEKLLHELSMEKNVKENAPDLFLWGTITDNSVNVMNSLLLVEAYKKYNCNCEYHLFPFGPHGLSLCEEETSGDNPEKVSTYLGTWKDLSLKWLKLKLNNETNI